jgi:recombination protein RecA
MAPDTRKARAAKLVEEGNRKYGLKAASIGHVDHSTDYWSTGITALDYALGTGGVPSNAFVEVFGAPEIGKTTIMGSGVLRSVQQGGGLTATIATEPDFHEGWMEEHGVDPELNIVYRADTGEEAYAILRDLIYNRDVDYVLFDSLGNVSSAKEQESEKPQAFGNAALNTWGIKQVAVRAWKNRVGVMFINQIRDDSQSRIAGMVKSTGGHAVHHNMKIRLQLKPGKDRYKIKVPSSESNKSSDDLVIGQEVRVAIKKNKAAQQLGPSAAFDFYHIDTGGEYPFGVDVSKDIVSTALVSGVIKGSGWLNHEVFPDGKINGKAKAYEFFEENPKAIEPIRKEVLEVMRAKEQKLAEVAKKKEKKPE